PDQRLEVPARQSLLLHPEFDRFDRVGRIDGKARRLVGVDQGGQHVEPIARGRTQPGAPQALDLGQRGFMILLAANRLDVIFHGSPWSLPRPCCRPHYQIYDYYGHMQDVMRKIQLKDAKANLSAVVDQATRGKPSVITRHGKPEAVVLGFADW